MSDTSEFVSIILNNWQPKELRQLDENATPKIIEVGMILCCQWGYEANNVDFYKVTKRTKTQVTLVELERDFVRYDESCNCGNGDKWVTASKTPKLNTERIYNPITQQMEVIASSIIMLRRKVRVNYQGEECVKIEDYSAAYIWNGRPVLDYNHH